MLSQDLVVFRLSLSERVMADAFIAAQEASVARCYQRKDCPRRGFCAFKMHFHSRSAFAPGAASFPLIFSFAGHMLALCFMSRLITRQMLQRACFTSTMFKQRLLFKRYQNFGYAFTQYLKDMKLSFGFALT